MNTNPLNHYITTDGITRDWLERLFKRARSFVDKGFVHTLPEKIIATCFFEPSTRTRLSFTAAAHRLGANVIGFDTTSSTSTSKGETLEDTIRMVSSYCDAIVMRHPETGSAAQAAAVATVPVINAGDGNNAHPSQTALDLFTIQQGIGRLDDFTIVMVGDMLNSRVAHSLATTLGLFRNVTQVWVSPQALAMPRTIQQQVAGSVDTTYQPYLATADIVMMTRVQQERFANKYDYEKLKNSYCLSLEDVGQMKPEAKIISPLPRTSELPTTIDHQAQAYYFQQAGFGVPVRAALLEWVLGVWQ